MFADVQSSIIAKPQLTAKRFPARANFTRKRKGNYKGHGRGLRSERSKYTGCEVKNSLHFGRTHTYVAQVTGHGNVAHMHALTMQSAHIQIMHGELLNLYRLCHVIYSGRSAMLYLDWRPTLLLWLLHAPPAITHQCGVTKLHARTRASPCMLLKARPLVLLGQHFSHVCS